MLKSPGFDSRPCGATRRILAGAARWWQSPRLVRHRRGPAVCLAYWSQRKYTSRLIGAPRLLAWRLILLGACVWCVCIARIMNSAAVIRLLLAYYPHKVRRERVLHASADRASSIATRAHDVAPALHRFGACFGSATVCRVRARNAARPGPETAPGSVPGYGPGAEPRSLSECLPHRAGLAPAAGASTWILRRIKHGVDAPGERRLHRNGGRLRRSPTPSIPVHPLPRSMPDDPIRESRPPLRHPNRHRRRRVRRCATAAARPLPERMAPAATRQGFHASKRASASANSALTFSISHGCSTRVSWSHRLRGCAGAKKSPP